MPKLKPISDPKRMAEVPTTEPILVALEPEPTGEEPEAGTVAEKPEKLETQAGDGSKQLKDQLVALQAAEDAQKRRADAAEAREREARQRAAQAEGERDGSERDLMAGSLQSAQSDLASAEAEMAAAYERADGPAIAKANAKIARASARIVHFEGAVAELEARKPPAQEPVQERQPQQLDPVTAINSNNALLPKEKEWLLTHQDALHRNDELNVGHVRAMKQGIQRGSDAYFQFMDDFMGYQKQERQNGNSDNNERHTSMSAPVSRESTSMSTGQRSTNQITLTPDEREMARSMGLTDVAYARNKLKLQDDKRANPERYGRTA